MAAVYTIQTGTTLNSHESFKSRLPWRSYKDVSTSTDCDVILAFCPVMSRVGTDIEAALREIPEGKPLALVVLHHTIDSNYTVPDTGRFVRRPDSITVDCLFSDDGLMECHYNDDAVKAVSKFLRQHSKHRGKLVLGLVVVTLIVMCVATMCPDFTFTTNLLHNRSMKEVDLKGNEKVNSLEKMLRKLQQNNEELEKKHKEFELEMRQSCKELEEKVNEKVNSLGQFRASQQKFEELANEKTKEFELKMRQGSEQLEKVNEKVNSLEEEFRASKQKFEELENKKTSEFELKIQHSSKELEEKINKKVYSLGEEFRASKQKFEELENKKTSEFELKIQQSSKELEKVNEKVNSLEEESRVSRQNYEELENKINEEFKREMQENSKKLENVNKKVNSLEEKVRALQHNYEELENKTNKKINFLEQELRASQQKCKELERIINSLEQVVEKFSTADSQQHYRESEEDQVEEKPRALLLFVPLCLLICFAGGYVLRKSFTGRVGETVKISTEAEDENGTHISSNIPQIAPTYLRTYPVSSNLSHIAPTFLQPYPISSNLPPTSRDKSPEANDKTKTKHLQFDNRGLATYTKLEKNVQLVSASPHSSEEKNLKKRSTGKTKDVNNKPHIKATPQDTPTRVLRNRTIDLNSSDARKR